MNSLASSDWKEVTSKTPPTIKPIAMLVNPGFRFCWSQLLMRQITTYTSIKRLEARIMMENALRKPIGMILPRMIW